LFIFQKLDIIIFEGVDVRLLLNQTSDYWTSDYN